MVVSAQFLLAPSIPLICVDLILRLPPKPAASPFSFTVDLSSFIAGRAVHSPPFDGQRAVVEGGSRRLPVLFAPGPLSPIVVPEPTIPFSNTDDHDNHSMILSTLDFFHLATVNKSPSAHDWTILGISAA